MTIGQRLKQLRIIKKLKLKDVSCSIGISTTALSQIENDVYKPSAEVVIKLSTFYKEGIDYILLGKHTEPIRVSNRGNNNVTGSSIEINSDKIMKELIEENKRLTTELLQAKNKIIELLEKRGF
jgi:transcriptional regulator with XRE-family HTH domain